MPKYYVETWDNAPDTDLPEGFTFVRFAKVLDAEDAEIAAGAGAIDYIEPLFKSEILTGNVVPHGSLIHVSEIGFGRHEAGVFGLLGRVQLAAKVLQELREEGKL